MIVPVLMAGGSGTRLWPLSRELYPKQFLKLIGDTTMLQTTALRAAQLDDAAPPVVVCSEAHRFLVAEQLRECGVQGPSIILEPEGRNTAPAAAVAALHVRERHGPEALVYLMSADHAVADEKAFVAAGRAAAQVASSGRITTFGIKPVRPETGYGYIKVGKPLAGGGFEIAQFVEKPDARRAQEFVDSGDYYWNAGLFLFPAGVLIDELKRLEPGTLSACEQALSRAKRDLDFVRLDKASFQGARSDSIDYAVMEKTQLGALVPMDAGWDDVGAWSYMGFMPATDDKGNRARGDVWLADTQDSLIHAASRMVAAVGVKNHIIVETQDAVLVMPRERAQDVKKIVQALKDKKRPEALDHPKVYRPWGSYETVALGDRFQVKRIVVKPGHKLSLQMHHHRAEHWIVVKGTARVHCNDKEYLLGENESTYIPLGSRHRLENPGAIPLELIEVQSGAYLGEDDIVRFEDVYGRTNP